MRIADLFRRIARPVAEDMPEYVDLMAPEVFRDPYPLYASLRRHRPVAPVKTGGYLLTRHADISAALTDARLGNAPSRFSTLHARNRGKYVAAGVAAHILPFLDKPEHIVPRRILSRVTLTQLRRFEAVPRGIAEEQVRRAGTGGPVELVSGIASPYVLSVMARFLGFPESDAPGLKVFTQSFFHLFAPIRDADRLTKVNNDLDTFRAYLRGQVEERVRRPREDMISGLVHTEVQGDRLNTEQVVDNCILLFADGVENVEAGIANTLLVLESAPEARDALRKGEVTPGQVVAEALRLDSPAQIIPRIAREEFDLLGQPIKADTPVFLALSSANRDAKVFHQPDRFALGRDPSGLITFGRGRHSCIGSGLASLQIEAMTNVLLREDFRVLTPQRDRRYQHRFGHRWPVAVHVGR